MFHLLLLTFRVLRQLPLLSKSILIFTGSRCPMSTSQSRPAGITWAGFPPEVQFKILKEALCTEGVTGRGAPDIARLSFVCKDWEREIQSRRARVPQKKKREKGKHGKIISRV
ncbi:hypothetical protein BJ875DRAFT_469704 [Amylocarpus encephaloides]|uniref:F-box domain-containing protein n=1 Tax=Amylocarpus encephaloides TaxID=45428 RepID=A0A9P7YCZ4_9HELO|nr:hypothetical protein BJ875DRAFT_469704 [Amylocarpus encephaloides]